MKRFMVFLILTIFTIVPAVVYAGGCSGFSGDCYSPGKANTGRIGSDGWEWAEGHFDDMYVDDDLVVTGDLDISGQLTRDGGLAITDHVAIPITSFTTDGVPLAYTSGPDAYIGEVNEPKMAGTSPNPAIILGSSSVSSFETLFRVPDNYLESPVFKVLASSNETGLYDMPSLDFAVKVSTSTSMDEAYLSQNAVQLTSTPDEATLTVVTDFESLAAGNWVTIMLNRNGTGSADMNIYSVAFEYTKKY